MIRKHIQIKSPCHHLKKGLKHDGLEVVSEMFFLGTNIIGRLVGEPLQNGGPLIMNSIYTLYTGYLLRISPLKELLGGLNS